MAKKKSTTGDATLVGDPDSPLLTIDLLCEEAARFAHEERMHQEPSVFGSTDGKALGTYLEQKFGQRLIAKYRTVIGNSAAGIDLPALNVDIKTTFITQPQSSCPFRSAKQKAYGLGYAILLFAYEKTDNSASGTATFDIRHVVYVEKERTGDYRLTRLILQILEDDESEDDEKTEDLLALFNEWNLIMDNIEAQRLAEELIKKAPSQGYLTISNAFQWRIGYKRVIKQAGAIDGIRRVS